MAIDSITVNGNQYDWGSVQVTIDGIPLIGVAGIKYSDKRERSFAYGTGKAHAPRGRTRGKYSAEAGITLWKDSADDFRLYLASRDPSFSGSFGNTEFLLDVQYFEDDLGLVDVQLLRCCVVGDDSSEEENADPTKEEFGLSVFQIVRNGVTLFDNSDGGVAGVISSIVGGISGALGGL